MAFITIRLIKTVTWLFILYLLQMHAYQSYTDQTLLTLLKQGDKEAYTVIYDRYKNLLYDHAYKKLGDAEEVKDVLQELFTHLWNKRTEINVATNLSGYLYTGIRNRILNLLSHKEVEHRYIASIQQYIQEGDYTTELAIREKEFSALIQKEIDALPPKMREVFLLSRKEHLSHQQIAEQLSISEQTVAKQVTNALRILRVRLGSFIFLLFILR
ncbi:RNA polymerase sigma-70 factor (ECF subfamily) [Chitinophagaceae bacterium OAS944]